MTTTSPSTSATTSQAPASTRRMVGTVLARVVVPLWLLAGAYMKISAMNPKLLPPPVLSVVDRAAGILNVPIAEAYEPALRIIVAAEIALAFMMMMAGRVSRPIALGVLFLFCGILVSVLASGSKSCNCMGPSGPDAWTMLAIDSALLLGVLLFPAKPCIAGAGRTVLYMLIATVLGCVIAFAWPGLKPITAPINENSGGQQPANQQQTKPPTGDQATQPQQPQPPPPPPPPVTDNGVTPWPGMPAQIQPYYTFEPEDWLNKRLDSQEMARTMMGLGDFNPNKGRVHIVLMRDDCEHCHELLEKHFSGKLDTPAITVAIPDSTSPPLANPCKECVKTKLYRQGDVPMFVITTPILITVKDGVVISICTDADDAAKVQETLNAGK